MALVVVLFYNNLHIMVECDQESQQPFHGKLPELPAQHLEMSGCLNTQQLCRGSLC